MHAYHICMHVYAWNVSKTDFNTKILISSRIMHRFQTFLMFWKAECSLFHLETTFLQCFVFVHSKMSLLWKVCCFFWTNTGSSIPDLVKFISQNTRNTKYFSAHQLAQAQRHLASVPTKYESKRSKTQDVCSYKPNTHENLVCSPLTGAVPCTASYGLPGSGGELNVDSWY